MHKKIQIKIFNTKEMVVFPNFSCYIFFRRPFWNGGHLENIKNIIFVPNF